MKSLKQLLFFAAFLISSFCFGQTTTTEQVKTVLTADSLKSGNSKDVFISFFQLTFNKLTSNKKEFNFNSNPFAVMLKSDPGLAIDSNYYRYRALRKTNFGFGINLDSSYKFNGFSSGVKYALVDKRDSSTSSLLFEKLRQDSLGKEADLLQHKLTEHARSIKDLADRKKFVGYIHQFFTDRKTSLKDLPVDFQKIVNDSVTADFSSYPHLSILVKNPDFNMPAEQTHTYDSLKNLIKNDLLWTVGVSDTTYKDHFFFSNILFRTELVKGIGKYQKGSNWEFNMNAGLNFLDDTLKQGRDLQRVVFNFEPGFNLVVRNRSNDYSFLELKFSGSYYRNFKTLYQAERRDSLSFNATLRIRIINDIWIPLEIKYDPKSGNVFGFLNVRVNFEGLRKLINPS